MTRTDSAMLTVLVGIAAGCAVVIAGLVTANARFEASRSRPSMAPAVQIAVPDTTTLPGTDRYIVVRLQAGISADEIQQKLVDAHRQGYRVVHIVDPQYDAWNGNHDGQLILELINQDR